MEVVKPRENTGRGPGGPSSLSGTAGSPFRAPRNHWKGLASALCAGRVWVECSPLLAATKACSPLNYLIARLARFLPSHFQEPLRYQHQHLKPFNTILSSPTADSAQLGPRVYLDPGTAQPSRLKSGASRLTSLPSSRPWSPGRRVRSTVNEDTGICVP